MNRVIPILLLCVSIPLLAGDEETKKKTKTFTVAGGAIEITATASGPLAAAEKVEVRLKPEKYDGGFTLTEVVAAGVPVKKGQVLMRFDPKKYKEALKKAEEDLKDSEKDLAAEAVERDLAEKKAKIELESAELSDEIAQHALEIWDKHGSHQMLRGEELSTLGMQYGLDDEAQELGQLEDMYKASELAKETKEIVLDRARRNIKITKERLEMQKEAEEILKNIEHPDQDRKTRMDAVHQQTEFELTKLTMENERKKREHGAEKAERTRKESREAYDKLVKDGALMEVVAPADGIVTHEEMKVGDAVDANKVVMEIWTPDKYELSLTVDESSVAALRIGAKADVAVAAAPEAQLTGMVSEASLVGKVEDATKYPFKVAVSGASPSLRFGMHAKVTLHGPELKDVLFVPRAAVTTKDGKSSVRVKNGDNEETKSVTLGSGNEDNVTVIKGLSKGDVVEWEEQ